MAPFFCKQNHKCRILDTSGCDQLISAFLKPRGAQSCQSTVQTEKEAKAEINILLVSGILYQQVESGQDSLMANHIRSDCFLMGQETSPGGADPKQRVQTTPICFSALKIQFQWQMMSLFKGSSLFYLIFSTNHSPQETKVKYESVC